ncbi:MAG: cysteine hydrolase [Thermodesulfobacteriota bacterium]
MADEYREHFTEIAAEPSPIRIDLLRTAVIVVDMQNAFVRKGGYFDLVGRDLSATEGIIAPCRRVVSLAREKGCRIIYLQMGFSIDLTDSGTPGSPAALKSKGLDLIRRQPGMKDGFYFYGTWGAEIIEELKPQPGDIVIRKQKYDGFMGTNLEIVLRTLGIRNLLFVGTATNVCVESTLRHAFFLDYFPILVSDAVSQAGSSITQQATILNVQSHFGWVTTSEELVRGMENAEP